MHLNPRIVVSADDYVLTRGGAGGPAAIDNPPGGQVV
jgi:hypothetical protein